VNDGLTARGFRARDLEEAWSLARGRLLDLHDFDGLRHLVVLSAFDWTRAPNTARAFRAYVRAMAGEVACAS
jgi:hypothetical protein